MARSLTLTLVAADGLIRLGEIDTYQLATVVARHNDVSTFEVELPADDPAAGYLVAANRPRIVFRDDRGTTFRSGPVTRFEESSSTDEGAILRVYGVDDLVYLRRRLAHPQPGSAAPPYSTTAYDTATGPASQVIAGFVNRNAGPLATPLRQVPGLTVPTPAAFGPTVTMSARWQNLLEFLQPAAKSAGIGIRIRDLAFEVFQPSGNAVFSIDLGTLAGWNSVREVPDVDYVFVAGGGQGTARVVQEYQDAAAIADWGRIESFQDRRDTSTPAELDQTGAETLAEGARPIVVDLTALDTDAQLFLRDWNVGDLASVRIGDETVTDVITAATVTLDQNSPAIVEPMIGQTTVGLASWRAIDRANRRIRQLERT